MEYTEEQKQEADSVVEKCFNVVKKTDTCLHETACPNLVGCQYSKYGCDGWERISILLAIQDRQSVLDELTTWDEMIGKASKMSYRILHITAQIEYLKSKI